MCHIYMELHVISQCVTEKKCLRAPLQADSTAIYAEYECSCKTNKVKPVHNGHERDCYFLVFVMDGCTKQCN